MTLQEPAQTTFDLSFKMLRVPVRVHPGFWFVCLLLNMGHDFELVSFVLSVAVLFVSILVHEFGHALSSRFFGERHNSIVLYFMGGLCIHENMVARKGQRIWTILWGPLAGFLLGGMVLGGWLAAASLGIPIPGLVASLLHYAMWINVAWGVLNLLPIFPMDGGQILREVVRWKYPRKGDVFVCSVSIVTATLIAVLMLAAHLMYKTGLLGPLLFASLAVQNYMLRKQIVAMGEYYGHEEEDEPRQPWEQDADWWKKN